MTLGALVQAVEHRLAQLLGASSPDERAAYIAAAASIREAIALMQFRTSYVRGGPFRNAEFASTPQLPVGPMFPGVDGVRHEARELLDALDALQRQLVFEADCAEATDALNNSRQYLQAAGYLDRAVAELTAAVR